VALLPVRALDTKSGWLEYPRPKTGVERRIPLWSETLEAIKHATQNRPAGQKMMFFGKSGSGYNGKPLGVRVYQESHRIFRKAGIEGLTFYSLRRTFQTVAEGSLDMPAVQAIMGHAAAADDMAAIYRQGVNDERLRAVCEYVREWLFGD